MSNLNKNGPEQGRPTRRREEVGHSAAKRARVPTTLYSKLLPIDLSTRDSQSTSFIYKLLPSLRPFITPPSASICGTFESLSNSIWVSNPGSSLLWQRGFFGKGSLSRSEPTWLQRAKNSKLLELLEDPRYLKLTPEELTAQRRIDRKASKIEKSKIKQLTLTSNNNNDNNNNEKEEVSIKESPSEEVLIKVNNDNNNKGDLTQVKPREKINPDLIPDHVLLHLQDIVDLEHLQLMNEEAFFLAFSIGALDVHLEEETESGRSPLSILNMWKLFCMNSIPENLDKRTIKADNPFILSYVVYHHFRSLGWVVRSGIKFCTDWVLYGSKGPVGGHAEFAVCMIPVFDDGTPVPLVEDRTSWRWLSTVNRVCSGVKKTLILVNVIVPTDIDCDELDSPGILTKYIVKEIAIKRFIPARMRD